MSFGDPTSQPPTPPVLVGARQGMVPRVGKSSISVMKCVCGGGAIPSLCAFAPSSAEGTSEQHPILLSNSGPGSEVPTANVPEDVAKP